MVTFHTSSLSHSISFRNLCLFPCFNYSIFSSNTTMGPNCMTTFPPSPYNLSHSICFAIFCRFSMLFSLLITYFFIVSWGRAARLYSASSVIKCYWRNSVAIPGMMPKITFSSSSWAIMAIRIGHAVTPVHPRSTGSWRYAPQWRCTSRTGPRRSARPGTRTRSGSGSVAANGMPWKTIALRSLLMRTDQNGNKFASMYFSRLFRI